MSIDTDELILSEPFHAPAVDGAMDRLFSQRDAIKARIEGIARALEIYSRIGLGQFEEMENHEAH